MANVTAALKLIKKPLINKNLLTFLTKTMTSLCVTWNVYYQSHHFSKSLIKALFLRMIFFAIFATCRSASGPWLNPILYKTNKKCPETSKFLSKFLKLVSKSAKSLSNGEVLKRSVFLKLALHLIPKSQTFAQ